MLIIHRLLWIGAFAAAFEHSQGGDLNSSNVASTPVLDFTVGMDGLAAPMMSSVHSRKGSNMWHALDGIPLLFSRPNTRKLSMKHVVVDKSRDGLDASRQMHRSLVFGDYADHSFTCPLTTTCPNVCVAKASDCPVDATCTSASDSPDHEFELCADGTCADKTLGEACASDLETPCGCATLSVACAKQVDLWDTCHDKFQEHYDLHAQCLASQTEPLPPPAMTAAPMLFFLCMMVITLLMFLWCAYNQRVSPVPGSSSELENEHGEKWTQTGYRSTIVGNALYGLIILGHVAVQALLFLSMLYYYVNYGTINETQVLRSFTIIWLVGFFWCFLLKYPTSIHALFLRRSLAHDATYLAVKAPVRKIDTLYEKNKLANLLEFLTTRFSQVMDFIFCLDSEDNDDSRTTYCRVETDPRTATRYFYFRMRRYIYDDRVKKFVHGRIDVTKDCNIGKWLNEKNMKNGLTMAESTWRLGLAGENVLQCRKPSIIGSIIREFSHPFYLYQNFMVWTWVPLWYYYMAIVQTVVRLGGGLVVSLFHYMSDVDLYRLMVANGSAEVVRDGVLVTIDKTDIVPGDVIRLQEGLVHCDVAILRSDHLLVDESALTGEVHPVSKIPLDPANSELTYDPKDNKSSTIFSGSNVLECGINDVGIVTQTGSFSARGELLSNVLSYEPHKFKFHNEIKVVLAILFVEMLILVSYVLHTVEAEHWTTNFFYAIYVAGTILPPLLPTVFVVSIGISAKRLQKIGITCTDSQGILAAGKVKKAFFDKTGTLTEQGLRFVSAQREDGELRVNKSGTVSLEPLLQLGISVCHTLTLSANGELIGPAVDRQAFSAVSSARLLSDSSISLGGIAIKYLKRFDFDHHSTTQSVIIQQGDSKMVFVKGSPEAISKLCQPSSLPSDFEAKARHSARNGIYQLAIARGSYTGTKEIHQIQRSDIEKDLIFTGCINFQNSMKQESPAVISELSAGNIESAMITGDNTLTGVYIAMKSGIILPYQRVIVGTVRDGYKIEWADAYDDSPVADPLVSLSDNTVLAMTGECWRRLLECNPKAAMTLGKKTLVFGRCTPLDKVSIVSTFVKYGDVTMMCGDGGNDSGALKAAHVGVALSDSEASVVAPFTSLDKSITSVTEVLKEGRCALASSFASYKYMLMYGQVETFNQVANAYFNTTFGEWCWFFMDGIWPITMAFSLPLSRAAKKLSKKHPTASILSPHTLSSACGVLGINFLFLVIAMAVLFKQDWFQCRMWDGDNMNDFYLGDNYESSVIFVVTGYQYISSAAAFNFGYTFRRSWWRNYVFVFFFALWTSMHFAATLHPSEFSCIFRLNCVNENVVRSVTISEPQSINNTFNTTLMPTSFRITLVILMVANLALVCGWQYFIVNGSLPQVLASKMMGRKVGTEEDSRSSKAATKNIEGTQRDVESGEGVTNSDQSDSKNAESEESDLGAA